MECDSPRKTGTSFLRTTFNGVNALAGLGLLSMPFAAAQGGWLSLILLFTVAVVCCYTGLLMKRCMDMNSGVKTYPDIGEFAFGRGGRILIAVVLYLELYLVAVEFLILEGDNMEKLFPVQNFVIGGVKVGGKQAFVLLGALAILPTTWLRSLSLLSYLSLGGVLASLIVVGSVLWAGLFDGVGFHERGVLINWSGISTAVSLYAFGYSGHSIFPTIYTSMRDTSLFSSVLFVTFTFCTLDYMLMATIGYLMYGENLKSQVTLNLADGKLSSMLAIYLTIVTPFVKYALLVTPIATTIENWFQVSKHRFICLAIRTTLVISTVVVALTFPFFGYVVALTGSFLSSTANMLLPCICYLKIFKNYKKWSFELLCILTIIAAGSVIAITGTYASLKHIVDHM